MIAKLEASNRGYIMDQTFAKYQPTALSLFRFITGLLLFQYGIAKFFKIPVLPYFAELPPLIVAAGALELVGGALLLLGLFTRPVAFILSGEMAFAYFMQHFPHGFFPVTNHGEPAVLFCFIFLFVAVAGPGAWSLDGRLWPRSWVTRPQEP